MWLKYQQVSTKMSSFDPREVMRGRDGVVTKHPLKRFEPTLRTSLQVVIPMNLERLKRHRINIKKFAYSKNWTDLNMEQINASRTAQQLQATIRDLGKIKYQINEDDVNQFEKLISPMKHEAMAAFHEFSLLQILITSEVQKSISLSDNGDNTKVEENITTAQLIDRPFATSDEDLDEFAELSIFFHDKPASSQIQLGDHMEDDVKAELTVCHSWDQLRDDLMELNGLVNNFSAEVHAQQEYVDIIEDNVDDSHKNVHSAATLLAQASKYKAAVIPLAGAVVGGLVGGPIGLLAGFKLAGAAAAVGGGIAGYQGGKYLKKKHDHKVETELENLSTPLDKKILADKTP